MDQGPDGLSMLLVSILIALFALSRWWEPSGRAARRILWLVTAIALLLFISHDVFGLIDLPVDAHIIRPVTKTIMAVAGLGLFGWAVRTFVTDYRRATSERRARESAERAPPS